MKTDRCGFTLIELMVVITIIGILASISIPSFQDKIIQGQVEESFVLAEMVMDGVEEFYKETGRMPKDNAEAGVPLAQKIIGNYVKEVALTDGVITITLGNRINKNAENEIISIRPAIVKDEPKVPIAWVYGYGSVPEGMSVVGKNETSISKSFLPIKCRY